MDQRKILHVAGTDLEELSLSTKEAELLEEVDISHNRFRAAPSFVQNCVNMTHLNCSHNDIAISEDTSNEEMEFFKPQLENKFELLHPEDGIYTDDDLPKTNSESDTGIVSAIELTFNFSKLGNLKVIDLSHNRIDWLPDSFFSLASLSSVNLSHNLITFLPHHFKSAENLRRLDLSWNLISQAPHWLGSLVRCVRICLSGNPLGELQFPPTFGNTFRRVRYLEIENTSIRNFPTALSTLLDLRHLKVSNTKITMEQGRSANKRIYFDSEKKNGECSFKRNTLCSLPETFVNLIGLSKLEMIDVELRYLPETFGLLKSLKILDVSKNDLRRLPRSLISLSNLEFCNISRNQLTLLDLQFEKMEKLCHLIACFNQITEISESLWRMKSLETLDLYSNQVVSLLPLRGARSLRRLDIACNPLTNLEELCQQEEYHSLQSDLRCCKFDWELFTREDYNIDTSIFQGRIEQLEKPPHRISSNRSLDSSFSCDDSTYQTEVLGSSLRSEVKDYVKIESQTLSNRLFHSRFETVTFEDFHQFDDAD